MIVICTKCQVKFKVADGKIGPRGAKVRCSRCQNVFLVHPDLGTIPADGAPPAPEAPPQENPFVANPVRAAGPPPVPGESAGAAAPRAVPPPLPFAASEPPLPSLDFAAPEPPLPPPPAGIPEPFGAPGIGEPIEPLGAPAPDPFSGAPGPDPFAPAPGADAPDPFAAPAGAAPSSSPDPFAPPGASYAAGGDLPLTDLSDLLGAAQAAAPAPPAPPPVSAPEPAAPAPAAAAPPPLEDDGGLALEDRLTPPPVRVSGPIEPPSAFGAGDLETGPAQGPFIVPGGNSFDAGFEAEPLPGAEALELANAPAPAAPAQAAAPSEAATQGAGPAPASPAERSVEPASAEARIPGRSRLRSAAVNAIALAALLVVALAMLVMLRSEGPIAAGMLRPSAVARALRSGRTADPFSAAEVRSGEYEREKGPPLLFVRGAVVSRAQATVRAVKVAVEVVRDGQVLARGEAVAGAIATPEELWRARDAAALGEVARAAAGRAPREVRPGDRVPFLVAISERPSDLDGASLRVHLAPIGERAP